MVTPTIVLVYDYQSWLIFCPYVLNTSHWNPLLQCKVVCPEYNPYQCVYGCYIVWWHLDASVVSCSAILRIPGGVFMLSENLPMLYQSIWILFYHDATLGWGVGVLIGALLWPSILSRHGLYSSVSTIVSAHTLTRQGATWLLLSDSIPHHTKLSREQCIKIVLVEIFLLCVVKLAPSFFSTLVHSDRVNFDIVGCLSWILKHLDFDVGVLNFGCIWSTTKFEKI